MTQQDSLKGQKVLILGFARQGRALARWLSSIGASVVVYDARDKTALNIAPDDFPDVQFVLGKPSRSLLLRVKLVCVSGGFPLDHEIVRSAVDREIPLTNDAQLFIERCPAPVIGITGSAGKTTTTTLVAEIVKNAGYTTWVGGNIGDVLLDVLDQIKADDVVIMELSSFQLELMKTSPQVGAVLNITPNHLDRHETMENYTRAKTNILRFQRATDIAVLCEDDPIAKSLEGLAIGEIVSFSMRTMVANGAFAIGNRLLLAGAASYDNEPHVLCTKDDIPLRGEHNIMNVLAACAIAGSLGLATNRPGISPEVMHDTIVNFKPVEHRMEIVGAINGVTYINDSIATAPERLMAALKSYHEPLVLLLGGADKKLPWDEAVHLALQKSRCIILFGASGEKQVGDIAMRLFRLLGADEKVLIRVTTLDEAVQKAAEIAQSGDIVLLSPGGTSFDAYPDFAARGEHFRQLVQAL